MLSFLLMMVFLFSGSLPMGDLFFLRKMLSEFLLYWHLHLDLYE